MTVPIAPETNRPSRDDLDDVSTTHPLLDVHSAARLANYPGAIAALGNLLDTLRDSAHAGVEIETEGHGIAVRAEFTQPELDRKLLELQSLYDRGRKLYGDYLAEPSPDRAAENRYRWDYYLKREQITMLYKTTGATA